MDDVENLYIRWCSITYTYERVQRIRCGRIVENICNQNLVHVPRADFTWRGSVAVVVVGVGSVTAVGVIVAIETREHALKAAAAAAAAAGRRDRTTECENVEFFTSFHSRHRKNYCMVCIRCTTERKGETEDSRAKLRIRMHVFFISMHTEDLRNMIAPSGNRRGKRMCTHTHPETARSPYLGRPARTAAEVIIMSSRKNDLILK